MLAGNAFDDVRRRKLQKLIKLLSFITCAPAHTGEKRFLVCVNIISSFVTQGVRAKPVDTLSANRSETVGMRNRLIPFREVARCARRPILQLVFVILLH